MINLGWKAGAENGPLDLLDGAVAAEQYGFDLIDVGTPQTGSIASHLSLNWAWMGAAAVKTHHILLGQNVSSSLLRSFNLDIAEAAQTLSMLAPGRAYISVNISEPLQEPASDDIWLDHNDQHNTAAESIAFMRELWSGRPVSYQGQFFHTFQNRMQTSSDQQVPLFIETRVPGDAYFAGYHGDGIVTSGEVQPQALRRILDEFSRGAREAGKDPARMTRMIELPVNYYNLEDPELEPVFHAWEKSFYSSRASRRPFIPVTAGRYRHAAALESEDKVLTVSHDPDCHAGMAQEFIDMGFNYLLFRPASGIPQEFIKLFGRDVLPRIRSSNLDLA